MRSTFANFAILASTLLVKDVLAAPHNHAHQNLHKRELYVVVDNIMVTEEVTVTLEADGSLATGAGVVVGTATIAGTPSLVSSSVVVPSSSSTPAPVKPTVSSVPADPATSSAAVFVAPPKPTTAAPAPPPPATTVAPVVVKPTTLATVAAPAPSAPAPVSNSANKRGLAFNDASLLSAFSGSPKVSWAYNWGTGTSPIPSDLNFTPMLWGLGSDHTNGWEAAATSAIASGSTHLLAFNEPDLGAQSNLSPSDAAAGYKQYMQPFAGKAKLVSPAVTNGGSPMGLTWLENFISACNGCQIDAVAFHWYNGGGADQFEQYVAQAYAAGGNRPLHITEFQASGSLDEQSAFLEQVIPFLDSSPMVERYAYFGVFQGNLVNGNALSSLGNTFANFV